MPMIIAVVGLAGSGKSVVAEVLAEDYGFRRLKFAEPLKNMVRTLLSTIGYGEYDVERYIEGDLKEKLVPELGKTSRFLQIDLGTRWGRGISEDLWVKVMDGRLQGRGPGPIVIDDLRFPNEEALLREWGALIIRVDRPGVEPAAFRWGKFGRFLYDLFGFLPAVHPSERVDLLTPDLVIQNTADLAQLRRMARFHISALIGRDFLNKAMN